MRHLDSQWRMSIGRCLFAFFEIGQDLQPEKQPRQGGEL